MMPLSAAVGSTGRGMQVGGRIAAARRRCGLTQKQLGEWLGVSAWWVDRMEAGAAASDRYLPAIAKATQVDVSWLQSPASPPVAELDEPVVRGVAADAIGRALVLCAIVLLVVVRFFTEVVPVVPRAVNFVDIPIFVALAAAAAFLQVTPCRTRRFYVRVGFASLTFLALCVLSVVVSFGRVAPAPVLVFIYGFLGPLAVYAAVYRLWPAGNTALLSRLIVGLGIVQLLVVAFVQLPRFLTSENPDVISGTFGTNAYQLVFFLLLFVALLVGIATNEPGRGVARFAPLLILASFVTILLAQYRSLLVSMAVAIVVIAILLGRWIRGSVVVAVVVVLFSVTFYYVEAKLPALKLESAASSLASNPGTYVSGRLRVAENVFRLYGDIPTTVAVGAGPGTYSSRAWKTFANAGSTSTSNVAGGYATALVGKSYTTDVSDKYVLPQTENGAVVQGSYAVSSPFSSYASLLAEVGVLGFAIIVGIYLVAVQRAWRMSRSAFSRAILGDSLPPLVLATTVAFVTLVQMALLENWFEVTRVTFIVWAMLAVCSKESDAREQA